MRSAYRLWCGGQTERKTKGMGEKSNRGGKRPGSGRKSNAEKLLQAGFVAPWFTVDFQETKWKSFVASDDEKIALDAMKYLTDRIHGKAKQAIEQSGPDGGPIEASLTVTFVKTKGVNG